MVALGVAPAVAASATARLAFAVDGSIGFAHETYSEDNDRMTVQTESLRVQTTLSPWFDLTIRGVYDAISGATPIGAPPIDQLRLHDSRTGSPIPPSTITGFTRPLDGVSGASPVSHAAAQNALPLANSIDVRYGVDVAPGFTFGPNRLVPEFSYSNENDYSSYAFALNYSLTLNDKNTILSAGWSHAYDQVWPNQFTYITQRAIKNTDQFIVGVTQLLGPHTIFSANGTIAHEQGYLNDPYRSVVFQEAQLDGAGRVILSGEKRPETRDSQALLLSLTQAITPLHASIEGSYRLYHDSFGILAHTFGAAWYQEIGRSLIVSPSFRYYRQDAANFYGIQFPGNPTTDPAHVPAFYSSDYRLSYLNTFTLGIQATWTIFDHWDLTAGYQRYWMRGLDRQTVQATYPNANIFTAGLTFRF
jgi:hypothetical protein